MKIRPEIKADQQKVTDILNEAFGGTDESQLVERIRRTPEYVNELSLVGIDETNELTAFSLLSEMTLKQENDEQIVLTLAPVAVKVANQKKGQGSSLIKAGIEQAKKLGYSAVIVLGHANYYPRFGFVPTARFGITSPFDVPEEYLMAIELQPGALKAGGELIYPPAWQI